MWVNPPIITYAKIPIAICLYRILKVLKIVAIRITFKKKPCQATLSRCRQIAHPSSSPSSPPAGRCTSNLVVGSFPCLLAH